MTNGFKYTPTLHVLFLFFFRFLGSSVPLSVRKNNFQICQLTHSPHVLTREVQEKRERESNGKLVPETDKNMLKNNKLCSQPTNNNTPRPKKKKNRTSITKTNSPCINVQPNFFQLPILSGISRNLAHWLKFRGNSNSHHEEEEAEGQWGNLNNRPLRPFVSYGSNKKVCGFWASRKP